jgi:hypothetical protein
MGEEKVAIYISKSLYNLITNRVKDDKGESKSVDKYTEFILREFFKEQDAEDKHKQEEEDLIKNRLRRLGYI